jgi:hypothetical protein
MHDLDFKSLRLLVAEREHQNIKEAAAWEDISRRPLPNRCSTTSPR